MSAFAGQTTVLTGASGGIGRAFARALAPQRPKLAPAARNRERLESLAAAAIREKQWRQWYSSIAYRKYAK